MIAIGVDAGGSSTVAALACDGGDVREASGPAANATTLGVGPAADAIVATIRNVAVDLAPDAIYVGAAGAGRDDVAQALAARIGAAYPHARVAVGDDAEIALRGAIPSGPGAIGLAGTGSIAYAENGEVRARVGGLGYLLGDEGSAGAIGLAAVRLLGRVYDGRAMRDETSDLVARTLDARNRDALVAAIYDHAYTPATIAALAPSIVAFAGKGNRASTKLVQEAAKDFGDLVKAATKAGGLLAASPAIALGGGLFTENSMFTFLVETRINGDIPGATIVRNGGAPVRGALALAQALFVRA